MTSYTAQDIKKLRDATGAGLLDCKNALSKAEGDYEKAFQLLQIDTEPQRKLDEEIRASKDKTKARQDEIKTSKEMQHLEHQKATKIASVESEIEMLKHEIFEIKKAHNALIKVLERAAANEKSSSKNPGAQSVTYSTYFLGDFSG